MAIKKFNPSKDWNKISWKESLWLNFLRAICVTPVMFILFGLNGGFNNSSDLIFVILWPIYYFIAVPILVFFVRPVAFWAGGPLAPLIWLPLCLIFISGGDPIVFLISKIKPQLVPIQDFKFINFEIFIFVEKPEKRRNGEEEMFDSDY